MKKFGTKFNKEKKQLFKIVGSFVVLGISAVICIITVFAWVFNTDVYGWVVLNKTSIIKQIDLKVAGEYAIDLGAKTKDTTADYDSRILAIDFDDIYCGAANSKKLELSIKNSESTDLYISWYFGIPNGTFGGAEEYYEKDNKYYYLGSQLAVSDITVKVNDAPVSLPQPKLPGKGNFLVETSPHGGGQALYTENTINSIPRLDLIKGLALPAGKTTVITMTFTFMDNGEDQSIYQNFEKKCSRVLHYKVLGYEET